MGDGQDSVDLADLFGLDGGRVHIGRLLANAGQGRLYAREGHPGTGVKLFSPAILFRSAADLRAKLAWMIEHPPQDVPGRYRFAWPTQLVVDGGGALAGYILPLPVDGVSLRALFVRARQPTAGARRPDWLTGQFGRGGDRTLPPGRPAVAGDWRLLAQAGASLAAATVALHELGYVVGDFHDGLVRVGEHGGITLVDCDTVQVSVPEAAEALDPAEAGETGVPLRVYQAPVGRPEFTPADLLAERGRPLGPAADDFALAVHCFALLLGGHRPYTGVWRAGDEEPSPLGLAREGLYALAGGGRLDPPAGMPPAGLLPPAVLALFDRAFGPGAGALLPRPTANEWHEALRMLADGLRTCPRTRTHHFQAGLDACPWCAREDAARARAAALTPTTLPPALPPGTLRPETPSADTPSVPALVPSAPIQAVYRPRATPPRAAAARVPGTPRTGGPRHRTPAQPPSRRWTSKIGSALLCLLGAALMVLTVLGAVDQPSASDRAAGDSGGRAQGDAAAPTAKPARSGGPAAAAQPASPSPSRRAAFWPWLGRWQSAAGSALPGFGLRLEDAGEVAGQEQITATETSGSCPVRYHGTTRLWPQGPLATYPLGASVRLTLDASLPAGQDPNGCVLRPDPASYTLAGNELTSPGVIEFEVKGALDDVAQAWVSVHPGELITLIMNRG